MLRISSLILVVAWAAPALCQQAAQNGSLIPQGIRAIATADDCAIILISDTTNGNGTGLEWLGIGGAIACDADNSIIVWSDGYFPQPAAPRPQAQPAPASNSSGGNFLWPEGIEDARPFDIGRSIIMGPRFGLDLESSPEEQSGNL